MAIITTKRHGSVYVNVPAIITAYTKQELIYGIGSTGGNFTAQCPSSNHDDHHPSWGIKVRTGIHNCFGCGWGW